MDRHMSGNGAKIAHGWPRMLSGAYSIILIWCKAPFLSIWSARKVSRTLESSICWKLASSFWAWIIVLLCHLAVMSIRWSKLAVLVKQPKLFSKSSGLDAKTSSRNLSLCAATTASQLESLMIILDNSFSISFRIWASMLLVWSASRKQSTRSWIFSALGSTIL